jgi:ribosomal protein S27AE
MRVSRIGHFSRRHPICPRCGYDLVATIAAERRTCPECGYEFELGELRRSTAPGDWTPARGLGRLVIVVMLRSAACLVAWMALLILCSMLCGWLATVVSRSVLVVVWLGCGCLVLVSGAVVGAVVGRRIDELAGFRSPALLAAPIIAAAAAIAGGAALATILGHPALCGPGISMTAFVLAIVLIVRGYLEAEY